MKFLILNGPNINLARWSEPGVPGEVDYTGLMDYVQAGSTSLASKRISASPTTRATSSTRSSPPPGG